MARALTLAEKRKTAKNQHGAPMTPHERQMKTSSFGNKKTEGMSSKNPFHGVLLVDKAKGPTSHNVVSAVRRILNQKAVGHAGTLDPLARGLMVILCGTATKLSQWLLTADKRYQFQFRFGWETDSLDLGGKFLRSQEVSFERKFIEKILKQSVGDLEIPVPVFSAMKIKGRKLYSYAFSGEDIKPPLKKMRFWDLEIHSAHKDSAEVSLSCSKGSYIRSWVQHLGRETKTGACLTELKRLSSGSFHAKNSLSLEKLQEKLSKSFPGNGEDLKSLLGDSFLFPNEALSDFPSLELTDKNAGILRQGRVPLYILSACEKDQIRVNKSGRAQILKAIRGKHLSALLVLRPFERIRILKNFPEQSA